MLCALASVACVREELNEQQTFSDVGKVYAAIEDIETKAQLDSERKTVWTEKDTICVFTPEKIACYAFDGKTGDRSGSFSLLNDMKMDIVPADYGVKETYAMYSYRSVLTLTADNMGNPCVFSRISAVQNYLHGSYGLHANVMFGTSSDGGKTFSFKNLFGYLRLSLTGSRTVRRITLWDNDYNAIAGRFYFMLDNAESIHSYDEQSDSIVLDCGEGGVQLSDQPTDFYFALPPCVMAGGFSISAEFTDGTIYHQRTTKEISIRRNVIRPMATLSTDGEESWQYLRVYNKGPQAFSPCLYGKTSVTGFIYWGEADAWRYLDGYSNSYNYMDGQDSHVMTVKVKDADQVQFDRLSGVTKIDLSEF